MSPRKTKKQRESEFIEEFALASQLFKVEDIEPDDRESPDFVVRSGDQRIGLELTYLIHEQSADGSNLEPVMHFEPVIDFGHDPKNLPQ